MPRAAGDGRNQRNIRDAYGRKGGGRYGNACIRITVPYIMGTCREGHRIFTRKEKRRILEKTEGVCARCGRKLDTDSMTVDHVFPVDKGGLDDEYNLLPECEECNRKKSNYVYNFNDYYKYVRKSELLNFISYNNYVTFDYTRKSIIGYDEAVFTFLPAKHMEIISHMKKRGAKRNKISEMHDKLQVPVILRRAYPASADDIFALLERERVQFNIPHDLYKSPYNILDDIQTGCVYVLENHDSICGAFIFKSVEKIPEDVRVVQMMNTMDETGLDVKYVMTCAVVAPFARQVLDPIMKHFESQQIRNGWLPVYSGIMDRLYVKKKECIIMQYQICGKATTLEFMPARHLMERRMETARLIMTLEGYPDVPDDDIRLYADLTLKYKYRKDVEDSGTAGRIMEKYPNVMNYFKPDTYEFYGAGIPSDAPKA